MTETVAHRELKTLENLSKASVVILDEEEIDIRLKEISTIYNKTYIEREEEKIDSEVALDK